MSGARRSVSLRDRLLVMGLVGLLFVVVVTLQLSSVLRPAAVELRGRTRDVLTDHDSIAHALRILRDARRDIAKYVPPVNPADSLKRPLRVTRDEVRSLVNSGVSIRASIDRSGVPLEMRVLLADALDQSTSFGILLIEAIRAVETDEMEVAINRLRLSGFRSDSADRSLSAAQRIAVEGLLVSQDGLERRLVLLSRWALAWLVLGFALFLAAAWIIRTRLLQPVRELDTAVQRIAAGDLATTVTVARADELGRLGDGVNTMAARLRERAAAETAHRESISERFGRLLDESSNEIGVFDATSLRALMLNRGARANLGLRPDEVTEVTLPSLLRSMDPAVLERDLARLRSGQHKRLLLRTRQTRRDGTSYAVEMTIQHSVDRDAAVFITVSEDAGIRERARELDEALRDFAIEGRTPPRDAELVEILGAIASMAAGALHVPRVSIWRESSGVRICIGASDTRDASVLASRGFPDGLVPHEIAMPAGARGRALLLAEAVEAARPWTPEEETFLRAVAALAARALDAEERRHLEQALARAQRLDSIGQLAGGVAHDFNNILTVILGNLESARTAVGATSAVGVELIEAEQAARRAADLTRQLLTFARHQRVDHQVVDLNALTHEAERMLRRLVGASVRIETDLHPAALPVRAGAGQVEQVLVNLAVNARDAMPGGGVIRIGTRLVALESAEASGLGLRAGDYVELRVSDTGEGMAAEVIDRVFDPFFTTKAPGEGTGLGLAVCYGIVRQAEGSIAVQSSSETGTTFRVLLPAVASVPAPGAAASQQSPLDGGETILIAEDERVIRDLVQRALERRGYAVLLAADGQEALEVARAHTGRIDLLVSDVVMPRLGGPELARLLRRTDPQLRVLLMSGYSADALREGQDVPGSDFVAKPFTPDELVRRVRTLLDRAPSDHSATAKRPA